MSPPTTPGSDSAGGGASDDARVGTILSDRYRLDSLLGEGGMGKVYAAEHVMMRKRLAVKVLHRELTAVPEVVARFEREAMAAANIEHPNVAAATDFGKLSDGSVFLVLEFVQGRNLRDEIAQGPMPIERALSIARQIAAGLAAAHSLEIVHRDLKPENVMLVEKGGDPDFVKVLDFGIAKVPIGEQADGKGGKPITKVGMVFGTPEYMAPEQALGQSVDGRADVYALGVMLYEMLAGVRPFSSKSPVGILGQQLSKNPPSVAERVPGLFVPPTVEHLLQHLLAREASERVQTASEVVAAIDALLGPAAPQSGARLFTMTSGSPPSSPVNLRVQTIPDLDEPVPVMVPPDVMRHLPSSPGAGLASSPGIALIPPPESFRGSLSSADLLEADLEEPSVPSIAGLPRGGAQPDRFRAAVDDIVHRVKHGFEGTFAWIDAQRPRLPPPVREPLAKVPAPAVLGVGLALIAGGVLVFVLLIGALIGGRGKQAGTTPSATASAGLGPTPSGSSSPAEPRAVASDDELAAARKAGLGALAELAAKYPKDVRVLLASAKLELADKKHTDAVGSIGKALGVDPSVNENPEVATMLWTTAQAKDSTDATFALLEGPMGTRGADMLHDLATTEGVRRDVRQRADRWLESEAFQKRSTPALNVLVALEKAQTCKQRYALLLRAKNQGDERALALLQGYEKKTGCGKKGSEDCNECLRSDKRLEEAIEAVKSRTKK